MANKLLYTTKEVADLLGISPVAVFKKIKLGKIRAEKIGRNYAIPRNELEILGIDVEENKDKNIAPIPEIIAFEKQINKKSNTIIYAKEGETIHTSHNDLFSTRVDINGQDIIIGFNEPAFKKSIDTLDIADLDSPLNARLITYFLPAVQIAKMQKTRPRLIIVTGINAALRYNANNEREKKIMYRNNLLKMKFIEETLEKFFPNTFSLIETRHVYDFLKISETKLDQLWDVFTKRYPKQIGPLAESLSRFSGGGQVQTNLEKLKIAFRYGILHIFTLGDVNLDYDFIHADKGYCSIGEHQEVVFNKIREIGYELLKDLGGVIFDREVYCFNNAKIIVESEGHVPPPYNGAFRSHNNKTKLDEVTYENNQSLSYYDERPRLKPHMDYLYKIIPRDVYEKYWNDYRARYLEYKSRYNEAYQIQ